MKRCAGLLGVFLCCAAIVPAASWAGRAQGAAGASITTDTVVVRVKLNTEDKGDVFAERTQDGDFLLKPQDLQAMGIREVQGAVFTLDGEAYVSLRSLTGATASFDEKNLTLDITAAPGLLGLQRFGVDGARMRGQGLVPKDDSLFVNYAFNAAGGGAVSRSNAGVAGELGWRSGNFVFVSDGATALQADGSRKFLRLMSNLTFDDRDALRRVVVGDFFTPSRDFSSGVNLGGISISKLYALNPYFVQFPTQRVSGNVALPSDLEVYVDGQRIRTERLRPGEFELRDILEYGGARNVQVLLRDAFGRVQQLDYSFYFTDQPLAEGLQEYSYNAGSMRRNYGIESNSYGPPALSMFHRYGWTNALTLGVRAEAARNLVNAGPTATVVMGGSGVAGLSIAASSVGARHGSAAIASYSYQKRDWSVSAWLRRDWGTFGTLGDPPVVTNRKAEGTVSASYYLGPRGTLSLSHSFLKVREDLPSSPATPAQPFIVSAVTGRRSTTLGYSVPLVSGWASLTSTLSHIKQDNAGSRNEAFVGVTVYLDKDYSVTGSYRSDGVSRAGSVQFTKRQPIGEGLGFTVAADGTSSNGAPSTRLTSSVQYNAPAAIVRADVGRDRDGQGNLTEDYRLSVAGGVGYVGGTLAFGRPVTDSFAIVDVGELAGVGVSVNGQPITRTNAQGKAFVPSLAAYMDNEVSVTAETIPIEYSIATITRKVSPSFRSGALIDFAATKLQAFSGRLKIARTGQESRPGELLEIVVEVRGKEQRYPTGRGGEFYVDNLKPGSYSARVMMEGTACVFNLAIPQSAETFVELGDVICKPEQ